LTGNKKSGVGGHFQTYLAEIDKTNQMISFRGHRFNHLFNAAGTIYHHKDDITDFLDKWSSPNDLLNSISFDIREPVYITGIRALGLIDKLITWPFWRLIEKVLSSLDLNTHLYQLKLDLERLCRNASPLLEGECVFSNSDVQVTRDCIYQSLTGPVSDPLLDVYT